MVELGVGPLRQLTFCTIPLAESCRRDMLRCRCSLTGTHAKEITGLQTPRFEKREHAMDHSPSASVGRPEIIQKVTRRLIPFVGISYLIAYIDRQNVSFAKLQMVGDLGLSE
jgi:hypothetical protein